MIDQSHNVTDPIESLMISAIGDRSAPTCRRSSSTARRLPRYQEENDALMAAQTLKRAFTTDVAPILAKARLDAGGAIDPVAVYRASGYRTLAAQARPSCARRGAGIV